MEYLTIYKNKVTMSGRVFSQLDNNASKGLQQGENMSNFNQPMGGNEMPRFGGPATMMRLPAQDTAEGLDVAFVGIPMDIGTSNRPGTRLGPRQIRDESRMLRPYNMATQAAPFDSLQVADIGDVPINTFNLLKSVEIITAFYDRLLEHNCIPLTLGGEHTITLPILRAIAKRHGPVGLIHIDAHADVNDHMFGESIAHGTPFRRAQEEGLLDPQRVVQIGLRGTGYSADDFDWCRKQGFRVVTAEACWYRSLAPLMAEVREQMGDGPVYITFDIDGLDPSVAPGTGTVEMGGLTASQGLEIVRGAAGLNIVGGDLVEVSPPYDTSGNTALMGATLLYEMLCVLPGVMHRD
jgi:guanidinobutyrase